MFNAIPASLLMELAKRDGYMEQLSFDFPPVITIKREYLTSVPMGYNWDGYGMIHSIDHPAFTELRERLGKEGFISIERNWSNGDRVTKPFYLNKIYFDVGERFTCAPALGGQYDFTLREKTSSEQYSEVSTGLTESEDLPEDSEGSSEDGWQSTAPLPF